MCMVKPKEEGNIWGHLAPRTLSIITTNAFFQNQIQKTNIMQQNCDMVWNILALRNVVYFLSLFCFVILNCPKTRSVNVLGTTRKP
jgi:hypothetical protein